MARECTICGKTGMTVTRIKKLRGKYNPTTKRKQKVNLQKIKVPEDIQRKEYQPFAGKSVLMCSKCRKTIYKKPRIRRKDKVKTETNAKTETEI